ncbi:MAG: hypothetical protein QOG22_660 [Pseudonocardiales bacterium]|nr:hypothetical protein [Pseudonocardiales bacterium]
MSRDALTRLLEEQAALRRVATLVARGIDPVEIFSAVADEVRRLLSADNAGVGRFEADGSAAVVVAGVGEDSAELMVGRRLQLVDYLAPAMVWRTGRAAQVDEDQWSNVSDPVADGLRVLGIRSMMASPIIVEGRLWGVVTVMTRRGPFPASTADRMADFTELAATAIANAQAHQELHELADTQAALRRLAMLVAGGESPEAVFAAATKEALRRFGIGTARMIRFELDGTATLVANEGSTTPDVRVGERWEGYPPTGLTATVWRTGQAARVDDYRAIEGGAATLREGIRSAAAVPIHVNGRLWGMIAVGPGPLPPDLEHRMSEFTELVATAVANAQTRAELITSRARIVTASDDARRRIERDLHDGTQQRLVSLGLKLRLAQSMVPAWLPDLETEIDGVADELTGVVEDLREIARGIHPAILSEGGLGPALRTLARRAAIAVDLDVATIARFPEPIEVAAYYVVSEAVTNATKHAHASVAHVTVEERDGSLRLSIRDDGVGSADPARGSGLIGLHDRAEALGGSVAVNSPPGEGTQILVQLPLVLR